MTLSGPPHGHLRVVIVILCMQSEAVLALVWYTHIRLAWESALEHRLRVIAIAQW
jgi:hypothetical protein